MALSTVPKTQRDIVTITVEDATATTTISANLAMIRDPMSISGIQQGLCNWVQIESRGVHLATRKTSRAYPEFSIGQLFADLSNATAGALNDFALKLGALSSGVSTLGANAEVFSTKWTLTWEGTDHGDSADHILILNDVVPLSGDINEAEDGNTIAWTWRVIGDISLDGNSLSAPS